MKIKKFLFVLVALCVWTTPSQAKSPKLTTTAPILLECVQFLDNEYLKPKKELLAWVQRSKTKSEKRSSLTLNRCIL